MSGTNSIFLFNFCHSDRLWRKQLLLVGDRMQNSAVYPIDECDNAFVKPKPIFEYNILDNLHKKADFV